MALAINSYGNNFSKYVGSRGVEIETPALVVTVAKVLLYRSVASTTKDGHFLVLSYKFLVSCAKPFLIFSMHLIYI